MAGTIRAFEEEDRQTLLCELSRVARGIAESMRGEVEVRIVEGYPVGINHPEVTQFAEETVREVFGDAAIHPGIGPSTGAEDFMFMSRLVPGTFLRLGVKDPAWPSAFPVHTPTFQIDERALPVGATALVAIAAKYLQAGGLQTG